MKFLKYYFRESKVWWTLLSAIIFSIIISLLAKNIEAFIGMIIIIFIDMGITYWWYKQ